MKLVYPVVLYPSGVPGGYTVLCPDMPGLVTEGRNLPEALDMAVDAASGWVLGELEEGRHEPHATNIADVKPDEPGGIVTLISLDMDSYAEKYGRKSVRKNVTIPHGSTRSANRPESTTAKSCAKDSNADTTTSKTPDMPTPQFTEWHTAEHLENEEDIRLYLDACKAYDDPRLMSFAQREAAKARENFSKRE